jgi:hypothetical protein
MLRTKLGFTYKKTSFRPLKAKDERITSKVGDICLMQLFLLKQQINLIYVDECSMSAGTMRAYQWVRKGEESFIY